MTILPREEARAKRSFLLRRTAAHALVLALCAAPLACHRTADKSPAPTDASRSPSEMVGTPSNSMQHGTVRFETPRGVWAIDAELARSPEEHARGLMWRRDLAPDHGMLFIFEESRMQRFWMHNTLLRLDMIFLGDDRAVVGVVENAEPQTDTPREVGKAARYVLEVAGGEAAAHGVGPGLRAQFLGIDE